ncbi:MULTISPECIES: hypothetical protein [unclassified Variovorax]|uniref:hypothetical protein n=1 Tax=unclassified Variovorax TaxID=663243 RepID=UPI00076CE2E5|nr:MULTISPECIES: hypothetical protein [unclassified Variovorax]KWT83881.1 hypothetical protein APY03_4436 [Variovorax sp. WDL1]PNG46563.1 hypothetical protein CHC06_06906 [Variovorax sp. B2]PNG47615.1 hypothetical protein CHC07_06781 [Variovorax sp. B4]VTV14330.1 hypothetical protein WDL1CHR_04879 [Variovorax sp. WDL1]
MSNHKSSRLAMVSRAIAHSNELTASTSMRVAEALAMLDHERITSVPGLMKSRDERAGVVMGDRDLSDEGKQSRVKGIASGTMGHLASLAKKIVEMEAEYRKDAASAVPLPEASPADVMIDLAIAAYVKQANPKPFQMEGMSERVRLAIARTPPELAGIEPAVQARVLGSLMDPAKAVQLGDEKQALEMARNVVQAAIHDLSPDAQETPREMVRMFGTGWKLPGVAESMAERLASEPAPGGSEG